MNTAIQNLTEEQTRQFTTDAAEFLKRWPEFHSIPDTIKSIQDEHNRLAERVSDLRRSALRTPHPALRTYSPGRVTDDCAQYLAAQVIALSERSGRLAALCEHSTQRQALIDVARTTLDLTTRSALSTSDIPLPAEYSGQLRELISQFGVARRHMFPYPIGRGTAKPARMGTRPTFGSIAMSGAVPEKSPTLDFASLESHKIGGAVRLPREIDEQSIVSMGQYLARYGAIEFARAEDTWAFLADGSGTYESVKGIVKVATDLTRTLSLAPGKTKPSDATLDDFRMLRTKVSKAALSGRESACGIGPCTVNSSNKTDRRAPRRRTCHAH